MGQSVGPGSDVPFSIYSPLPERPALCCAGFLRHFLGKLLELYRKYLETLSLGLPKSKLSYGNALLNHPGMWDPGSQDFPDHLGPYSRGRLNMGHPQGMGGKIKWIGESIIFDSSTHLLQVVGRC